MRAETLPEDRKGAARDWPGSSPKRPLTLVHPSGLALDALDRKPCYFSIDFEDFLHDFQRTRGVKTPRRGGESLMAAYEVIEDFANETLSGARLTFFVTGQVARDYPDIVRRIAGDGHEIGCHYYEHDQIRDHDPQTFRRNLERAVDVLSAASGQPVRGFRAPDFSIDGSCADWAYEALSDVFAYDSSYVSGYHDGAHLQPSIKQGRLREFAIYQRQLAPGLPVRVIGGTYLRFLPSRLVISLLEEAWQKGFVPQVYLHPYDWLADYEQWSTYADLRGVPRPGRLYWWLRQHQWHSIGNRGVIAKLKRIYQEFTHPGPLGDAVQRDAQRCRSLKPSGEGPTPLRSAE
jgi:hypothetical protein